MPSFLVIIVSSKYNIFFNVHIIFYSIIFFCSFIYIFLHLCSKIYFQGIFYAIVISGLRVFRVCYGPLPIFICNIAGFLNACALLFAALTVAMSTFTRFMFVCVWKRMRQMDDNLIVRIATIQAIVMTLFFRAASWSGSPFQGQSPVSFFCFCFAY